MGMGKGIIYSLLATAVVSLMLFLSGCMGTSEDIVVREDSTKRVQTEEEDQKRFTIYLITKNQASNYWQQLDAGCRKAVKEMGGIEYHWTASPKTNIQEQKELIDEAVASGADAILLSAISATDLNGNLAAAAAAGVKIVYVDSGADYEAVATLMTDNVAAGRTAAKTMVQALAKAGIMSGVIGLAIDAKGQASTKRAQGFREELAGSAYTTGEAFDMNDDQQNIKNAVKNYPDYVAFFGANEQTTWALSTQIYESGMKQIVVGFDTSDRTLDMIQKGVIYATMQQKPQQMGYEGIRMAVDALTGKNKDTGVVKDMGVNVITRDKI